MALGLGAEEAHGSIRMSLGRENTAEEVDAFLRDLPADRRETAAHEPAVCEGVTLYTDLVMDHFNNPRNVGAIADADGVGQIGNPTCGDVMRISIRVEGATVSPT